MKKIINFFKKLFKLLIGFFSEYISSKSKVVDVIPYKELEDIKEKTKYIATTSFNEENNSVLSIYEERLNSFKDNIKLNNKVKDEVDEILVLINKIKNKEVITSSQTKKDDKLKSYVYETTILLDIYYHDYSYYINNNKLDYLPILSDKVNNVLKEYNNRAKSDFKKATDDIKEIDKYKILKNGNKIVELSNKIKEKESKKNNNIISCSIKEDKIIHNEDRKDKVKKVEKINNNIEQKIDKKIEENIKRKEEEKKNKLKENVEEILLSIGLINKNITSGEKLASDIRKGKKRKSELKRLLNQSIKIGFSLFPIALFKNKLIGILTSSVILNNTIRSMRRGLNSDIEYIKLDKDDYLTNDSIITKTEIIKMDILNEISLLKDEIKHEYIITNDIELLNMYKQIEEIELELKEKEEKTKSKVKIKLNKKKQENY